MTQTLKKLVTYIADNIMDATEAQAVIQYLSNITDWDAPILDSKKTFRKRQYGRVYSANQRVKGESQLATLTIDEWLYTLEYFNRRCAYCREKFSYEHLEHFFPLADPESPGTTAYNCVPACSRCNLRKGAVDVSKWLRQGNLANVENIGTDMKRVYAYLKGRYQWSIEIEEARHARDLDKSGSYYTAESSDLVLHRAYESLYNIPTF